MYRDGQIHDVVVRSLKRYADQRGWLIELFRHDELPPDNRPQMAYVSETRPGVTRGPHEHVHQSDCFAFVGPSDFRVFLWDARPDSPTHGVRMRFVAGESQPQLVIIPPGVVHAYKNVGEQPGWVFDCPNRLYAGQGKQEAVDEIRHEDRPGNPFEID